MSDHQAVSYRGILRGLPETLEAIRFDLMGDPPLADAWLTLSRLAVEGHAQASSTWLAGWLAAALARVPARAPALATLIHPVDDALLAALAALSEPAARALALDLLARRPAPAAPVLVRAAKTLLSDRSLDEAAQERIAAAHLTCPKGEALGVRMLRWLTARMGRTRALARLERLWAITGPHLAIERMVERKRRSMLLSCPRCKASLRRDAMARHLWHEHRLLLDGQRVVEPWELIEEWARRSRAEGPELLDRCRLAALRLDPEGGAERLGRVLLSAGVGDPALRATLLARAREAHSALCPWCHAAVPVPVEAAPLQVNLRPGRLSAGGYEVEVADVGLFTRLRIATPAGQVMDAREPDQPFTPSGAATLFAGPVVALALLLALFWPGGAIGPVLFLLGLAALVAVFSWLLARFDRPSTDRLLVHAWGILVPGLNSRAVIPADCAFLAGLAHLSSRLEWTAAPLPVLHAQQLKMVEGSAAAGHLAALCRLEAEVEAARGGDPIPVVEGWVSRCFDGRLPLSFAQHLLEDWAAAWWTPGQLARLRVRLCDRAFEAGFEVRGLLDAGTNAPALGATLKDDDTRGLGALRLLWSLRPGRPWARLGDVKTAFELASDPARLGLFEAHPGLLLWQIDRSCIVVADAAVTPMRPAEVVLTAEGVWLQDVLFSSPPRDVEVRLKHVSSELLLDGRVFRSPIDLERLARLLEKWFRLAFHEFMPAVDRAAEWVAPDRAALLRSWGAVPCPECGRFSLPRVGAVGLAMEGE